MPFPLSAEGFFHVPLPRDSDGEVVIAAVVDALRAESPSELSCNLNEIHFRGGGFRLVGSWNQLVSITSGLVRFSFSEGYARINYRITFTELLALLPAILGLFCLPAFASPWFELPTCGFFVLLLVWLFGGNYIITCFRFPRFLRRAAQASLDSRLRHARNTT